MTMFKNNAKCPYSLLMTQPLSKKMSWFCYVGQTNSPDSHVLLLIT